MERERPTMEELGLAQADLIGLVRECEESGACPSGWADGWRPGHTSLEDLGCPRHCMLLGAVEEVLWQGPLEQRRPASDEIPF